MMRNRMQHQLTTAFAALVAAAVLSAPAFAGGAHSTRPSGGSSGGSVSRGSSGSSHSSPSHGSSGGTFSGSSGGHHSNGRTPVSGTATWHQGGHGGHGYGHGGYGYGYGYGYPYYGYGAYWNNWWWSPTWGPWSIGWWGSWGPYSFYYDTPPYYVGTQVYPNDQYGAYGALDLDVSPERAEVFVNGQRVGTADDYDGYPTYLWLEQGVYDLVFYSQGFQTIARQYVIRPGMIIAVEDAMVPGESIRPEDLPAKTHENRDARLRQNREVEEDAARGMYPGAPATSDSWRDRVHPLDRAPAAGAQPPARLPVSEDARLAPSRLKVNVDPDDASIYLDGRFVGTGGEIEQMPQGLLIDAGVHRIEAVRPGRRPVTREFTAEPGGESVIELSLSEPAS